MAGLLAVVGSVNVDATVAVERFPEPGETVTATSSRVALGGKGANQAVAALRAGAEAVLLARVGDDPNGGFALAELASAGLDVGLVETVPDAATGTAAITVARSGENTVIVSPGANWRWTRDEVDAALGRVPGVGLVLAQAELPADAVGRLADRCAADGIRLVLNLAPPIALDPAELAVADPLIVNEHEAREVGVAPGDREPRSRTGADSAADPEQVVWERAVRAAVTRGLARSLVVTLGARGAVAAWREASGALRSARLPAPRVEAVDTTGAGDGFAGTLAAALVAGAEMPEALRLAVAASALSVTRHGTVASYAGREEVLAFLARNASPAVP